MTTNIIEFKGKIEYSRYEVKKEAYGEVVNIISGLTNEDHGVILDVIVSSRSYTLYAIQLPSGARTYLRRHQIKPDRKLNNLIKAGGVNVD